MKRILVLLLIFGVMLGCLGEEDNDIPTTTDAPKTTTPAPEETGQPETTDPPEDQKETKSIDWVDSVEKAKEKTNEEKWIFVYFTSDNCPWCKELEETTYKDDKVVQVMEEYFIPVYFDLDIESNEETFKEKYRQYVGNGIPSALILDSNGKPLYKLVGPANITKILSDPANIEKLRKEREDEE